MKTHLSLLFLLAVACDSVESEPDPSMLETLPDAAPAVPDSGTSMSSPEAPSVSALNVRDVLAARAAHQGATGVPLHIHGERLSAATVVIDGVQLVTTSFSETELVVSWNIPHGARLGGRTVVVANASGMTTVTDGVEVTAIHIDSGPENGDGTPATPYGELETGLALASAGDEVRLHGPFRLLTTLAVPAGVHVIGDGKETVLEPALRSEPEIGVSIGDEGTLSGVRLSGFAKYCLGISDATVQIRNVLTEKCPTGLGVGRGASVELSDSSMSGHETAAVLVQGKAFHGVRLNVIRSGVGAGIVVSEGTVALEASTLSHGGLTTPGTVTPLLWDKRDPLSVPAIQVDDVAFGVKKGTYKGPYLMNGNLRIEKPDNNVVVK